MKDKKKNQSLEQDQEAQKAKDKQRWHDILVTHRDVKSDLPTKTELWSIASERLIFRCFSLLMDRFVSATQSLGVEMTRWCSVMLLLLYYNVYHGYVVWSPSLLTFLIALLRFSVFEGFALFLFGTCKTLLMHLDQQIPLIFWPCVYKTFGSISFQDTFEILSIWRKVKIQPVEQTGKHSGKHSGKHPDSWIVSLLCVVAASLFAVEVLFVERPLVHAAQASFFFTFPSCFLSSAGFLLCARVSSGCFLFVVS